MTGLTTEQNQFRLELIGKVKVAFSDVCEGVDVYNDAIEDAEGVLEGHTAKLEVLMQEANTFYQTIFEQTSLIYDAENEEWQASEQGKLVQHFMEAYNVELYGIGFNYPEILEVPECEGLEDLRNLPTFFKDCK